MLDHEIEELAGLRAQLAVHLLRGLHHLLLGAVRRRIALRIAEGLVVVAQLVDADALCLPLVDAGDGGHDILPDALAEVFDVLLRVIIAPARQVCERDVVLIADQLRLLGADLDHLVVDIVQLVRDPGVHLRPFAERAFTDLAVRVLHEFQQSVEIAGLAHILGRAACGELTVLAPQYLVLRHARDQTLVGELHLRVRLREDDLSERRFQLLAERVVDHRLQLLFVQHDRLRKVLIVIGLLRVVEFVLGVDVVTDVRDRELRRDLLHRLVHRIIRRNRFFGSRRVLERVDPLQSVLNELVDVHAFIG